MTAEYAKRFRQLVKDLEDHPKLDIDSSLIERGYTDKAIQKIEKTAGLHLPESLRQFYGQVGEVQVQWTVRFGARNKHCDEDSADTITGSIHLLDLETMLLGPAEEGWKDNLWFDFMEEAQIDDIQRLRPFDYFYPDGNACAGPVVEDGRLSEQMYLHTIELDLEPLGITIRKYLDLLLLTRGFMFWQEALAIPEGVEGDKLRHYLPQLFPKVGLSPFQAK